MNILFLDLETTGLDPYANRIIEIAAALFLDYNGNVARAKFHEKLSYGTIESLGVSLGALVVNGAKFNEFTDSQAVSSELGLRRFAEWLVEMKRTYGEFVVCGHNVHFDIEFLKTALMRLNITDLESVVGHRYLDTSAVALFLKDLGILKADKVSHEALAKAFDMSPPKHTAVDDVEFTEQIYYNLITLARAKLATP